MDNSNFIKITPFRILSLYIIPYLLYYTYYYLFVDNLGGAAMGAVFTLFALIFWGYILTFELGILATNKNLIKFWIIEILIIISTYGLLFIWLWTYNIENINQSFLIILQSKNQKETKIEFKLPWNFRIDAQGKNYIYINSEKLNNRLSIEYRPEKYLYYDSTLTINSKSFYCSLVLDTLFEDKKDSLFKEAFEKIK
ncbi:MAG: hypothetical protein SFY32_15500 [Bacteroidota bacterium]|nr:hypothetical protein [Bacteroidota bacterium]